MQKVTGIGGVFIKANDPKKLTAWYQKHLGINFGNELYVDFKWNNKDSNAPGHTIFSFFKTDSTYFNPSLSGFMINFRVDNLIELIASLKRRRDGKRRRNDRGKVWKICMDNGSGRK